MPKNFDETVRCDRTHSNASVKVCVSLFYSFSAQWFWQWINILRIKRQLFEALYAFVNTLSLVSLTKSHCHFSLFDRLYSGLTSKIYTLNEIISHEIFIFIISKSDGFLNLKLNEHFNRVSRIKWIHVLLKSVHKIFWRIYSFFLLILPFDCEI